jgi:hypothetical protein
MIFLDITGNKSKKQNNNKIFKKWNMGLLQTKTKIKETINQAKSQLQNRRKYLQLKHLIKG